MRSRGVTAAAAVFGLLLLAAVPHAQEAAPAAAPIEVRARVEPDTVPIGTPFRLVVEVAVPSGVEVVLAQPAERIGAFDILDFGDAPSATRDGKTVVTRWYQLVGYEPGHHLIPTPPVHHRRPGEPLAAGPSVEAVVTVESVLARAGNPTDVRDVKPPEEPPPDWRPYWIAGAAAAILVAAAALVWWVGVRRAARVRAAPPLPPPHELARRELDALQHRRLAEAGAFKEYYSALSTIVRTYLERRFALRAPEMTTEEFLFATARGGRLSPAHRGLLGEFLGEADLVKFARHRPTVADAERAWAAAARFVAETASSMPDGTEAGAAGRTAATPGDGATTPGGGGTTAAAGGGRQRAAG